MTTAVTDQSKKMLLPYMADKYALEPEQFSRTVRATCGLPTATPEEFAAFLIVCKTYDLNPILREIYAFPKKGGGIVPIVSIDGWINLINSNGNCDGYEFEDNHEDGKLVSITCKMHRKDRKFPVTVTEYLSECVRSTDPWKMQHRMLRHKALIQAARYAFGFSGIYDEDEGQKIAEGPRDAAPPRSLPQAEVIEHQEGAQEQIVWEDEPANNTGTASAEPEQADQATFMDETPQEPEKPTKIEPHFIGFDGMTTVTWSDKYVHLMRSSDTLQEVYRWIDLNHNPLDIIKAKNPAKSAEIKKATEARMDELRKIAPQTVKAETKRDAAPPRRGKGKNVEIPGVEPKDRNPETVRQWADATLSRIEDPDQLADVWASRIEPYLEGMFPPDIEDMQGLYRHHEQRLQP